jgi:hypothetical protein
MLASAFLTVFGLGAICWLLFTLAVYALPFWLGLSAAFWLHATEQGIPAAILGGLAVAGGVAILGEIVFARLRSVPLRLALGLVYAIPAGLAGFHASKGLSALSGTGEAAGLVLAALAALFIGGTAFARVAGWPDAGGFAGDADSGEQVAPGGVGGLPAPRSGVGSVGRSARRHRHPARG